MPGGKRCWSVEILRNPAPARPVAFRPMAALLRFQDHSLADPPDVDLVPLEAELPWKPHGLTSTIAKQLGCAHDLYQYIPAGPLLRVGVHEGAMSWPTTRTKSTKWPSRSCTSHRCGKKRAFVPGRGSLGRSRIECSRRAGSAIRRGRPGPPREEGAHRMPHSGWLGDGLFELRDVNWGVRVFYTFLSGRRPSRIGGRGEEHMREKARKTSFEEWLKLPLSEDPALDARVAERLSEMRIEQDLIDAGPAWQDAGHKPTRRCQNGSSGRKP